MPKTIPCYDCKGKGSAYSKSNLGKIKCKTCKGGGVLSVYTQDEVNDLIKAETDSCILDITEYVFEWKKKTYVKPYIDVIAKGMVDKIRARKNK